MKILFLDMDGVMNNDAWDEHVRENRSRFSMSPDLMKKSASTDIDPVNIQNLKFILKRDKEIRIVISSSWRNHLTLPQLQWIFKKHGIMPEKIIGMTDRPRVCDPADVIYEDRDRGELCVKWAQENNVTSFVCVDDDWTFAACPNQIVRTTEKNGLTRTKAEAILRLFGHTIEKGPYEDE